MASLGRAFAIIALSMLTAVAWSPATATNHDRDCMAPASPNVDAWGYWVLAGLLVDHDCTGEMLLFVDNDDWYYVNAATSVKLCPLAAKNAPWNPDLELFFRPTGTPNNLHWYTPAGIPLAAGSNGSGCEEITVPAPLGGLAGRYYIHVARTTGDGLYNLVVT